MRSQWWYAAGGESKPPVGVIFGTLSTVPPNWSVFSAADGKFLKGTDSDALVGVSGSRTSMTDSSSSGGGHGDTNGTLKYLNVGSAGFGPAKNPSRDASSQGSHTGHSVTINFVPAQNKLKLIQADADAEFTTDLIGFSTTDLSADHTPYTGFNNSGYLLYANSTTTTGGAGQSTSGMGNAGAAAHDHLVGTTNDSATVEDDRFKTYSSTELGSHAHSGASLSLSHNVAKALLRAWALVDVKKMEGVIGMYAGAGCPDGWQIVASLAGQFIGCDAGGTGVGNGGANTVSFSGTFNDYSHAHSIGPANPSLTNDAYSYIGHTNSEKHNHTYSHTKSYEPERYYIKFIKYIG